MSLGFLTESALLPSKAKQIKVDSKSILDLKAVVFQKEQERKERRRRLAEEAGEDVDRDARGGSSRRRKRSRGADTEQDGDGYESGGDAMSKSVYARLKVQKRKERELKRNRGVESRSRRDDEQRELDVDNDDDDEALKRKSREMLERKTKLYEQMMQGKRDAVPSAAVKECLVDFDEKRRATGAAAVVYEEEHKEKETERLEITDEFGRTRMVEKGSEAHLEYARAQQQPQSLYYEDKRQERGGREAEDSESVQPSGSFVVSQWEKTLNATEKQYLEQVHAGVQLTKQSAASMDKQSRKQQRLEKLRRQQQLKTPVAAQGTMTEGPADPQQAQDAEHKATAFLSQFTSLM